MKENLILITTGDPAGIGPEIVRAALASGSLDAAFRYEVMGAREGDFPAGAPTPEGAKSALAALELAATRLVAGEARAVVTAPVGKAQLYEVGFRFPGQTEFFAARAGVTDFAMMLTGGGLTVALVSIHIPLREAVATLNAREIVRVGNLLATELSRTRQESRIAVAGLNPHAGEGGALGREEIEIIAPALRELKRHWEGRGVDFSGPLPPDTVFWAARRGDFDAVLCMYHDQGLIPLKLVGFEDGVNVTLGLPFVRTSPDHGTAFSIAGKGIASASSLIAAIRHAAAAVGPRGEVAR